MEDLRLEPSRTPAPLAQTADSAHNSRPVPRTATKFSCPHCKSDLSALAKEPEQRVRHILTCRTATTPHTSAAPPTPAAAAPTAAPAATPSAADPLALLMASGRKLWGKAKTPAARTPPAPVDAFARMLEAQRSGAAAPATAGGADRGRGKQQRRRPGTTTAAAGGGAPPRPAREARRLAPFKRVEGTNLIVDGFTATPDASCVYFLSHFHADHYVGLTKRWPLPVYCSQVTADLLVRQHRLSAQHVRPLPMGTAVVVPGSGGGGGAPVLVTLIDANHCPGAVLFLFTELPGGRAALHTGDFRYHPETMARHAALAALPRLDLLYLDTTYAEPRHRFPTQAAAIAEVVAQCRLLYESQRTLVLFGTYSIGKERVFLAVARALGVKLYAEPPKRRILDCIRLPPDDAAAFVDDAAATRWRVVPMGALRVDRMRALLRASAGRYDAVVGFRPSGWSFGASGGAAAGRVVRAGAVRIHEVPYSEHSSFAELRQCVRDWAPVRVVPTVSCATRDKARAILERLGAPEG